MAGPQIVAKFVADTSKLTSEIDNVANNGSSKLSSFGKKAAAGIAAGFAVGAVVDFGKAAIQAAQDDAAAQATLAQTLKNVTGATDAQVKASEDYIGTLSKQVAIADDDLRPAYDKLVRAYGNTEDAQKALTLATDVAAGTGKDLSTVTDAMMKAAQGNTGALKKMGIEITNADGSAKSLDEIMASMSETFKGQAATAADTTAGRMKNASIQFGEFQEQLGTAVLPLLSAFADILTTYVIPTLSAVATYVQENISWLGPMAAIVGAVTAAVWLFNAALAANPIVLVTIALAALVGGIIYAYNNVKIFKTIVDTSFRAIATAFGWITDAAETVFNWLRNNWPTLVAVLTGPFGIAVLAITKNWDTIKDAATDVYDWIKSKFDSLVSFFSGIAGTIGGIMGTIANAIKAPINAIIQGWNNLEFKVPRVDIPKVHIPGVGDIGGGGFGGQTIGFPNISKLATGGVVSVPTLALIGEGGETEVVAPESMLRAIMREEAGGNYTLNIYPRRADASDVAYGFRRLELMAGVR